VVASIVPRLLNTRSRAGVYELGGSGCVHPGASARGGILARSLATAALSLSLSEKALFPSRGRQTRTIPSDPPTASSWPSSEKAIGPVLERRSCLSSGATFLTSSPVSVDQMLICP
jgi:hypothetical protein